MLSMSLAEFADILNSVRNVPGQTTCVNFKKYILEVRNITVNKCFTEIKDALNIWAYFVISSWL